MYHECFVVCIYQKLKHVWYFRLGVFAGARPQTVIEIVTARYDAAKLDLTTHASQATPARTSRSLELFSMWSSERSRSCGGNIETRKTSFFRYFCGGSWCFSEGKGVDREINLHRDGDIVLLRPSQYHILSVFWGCQPMVGLSILSRGETALWVN